MTELTLRKDELALARSGLLALRAFVPGYGQGERRGAEVDRLLTRMEPVLGPTPTVPPEMRTPGVDYNA